MIPVSNELELLSQQINLAHRAAVQAELIAPGYVSMDGTAAELIWGEQPDPAQPITIQVTMSLF